MRGTGKTLTVPLSKGTMLNIVAPLNCSNFVKNQAVWSCLIEKKKSRNHLDFRTFLVEISGIEPLTSWMPFKRSPSWAIPPYAVMFLGTGNIIPDWNGNVKSFFEKNWKIRKKFIFTGGSFQFGSQTEHFCHQIALFLSDDLPKSGKRSIIVPIVRDIFAKGRWCYMENSSVPRSSRFVGQPMCITVGLYAV